MRRGLNLTCTVGSGCPETVRTSAPVAAFQTQTAPFSEPDATYFASGLNDARRGHPDSFLRPMNSCNNSPRNEWTRNKGSPVVEPRIDSPSGENCSDDHSSGLAVARRIVLKGPFV
eukprot:Amastigsp_a339640_42.p4 type:complete len:116 gc:universal Amastigsp_a339640_42:954-607(-)